MTEKFTTCETLPSAGTAVARTEELSAPLCSLHTEVVFSPEILSNDRKEEQSKGGPFVALLLVVMDTGLETEAAASTDSPQMLETSRSSPRP